MFLPHGRQDRAACRPGAGEQAPPRNAVEQREYSRPRVFAVGPAVRLVRGGFFGKAHDGYMGYYTEH